MSLIGFHKFFITVSIVFFGLLSAFEINQIRNDPAPVTWGLLIFSVCSCGGFIFYLIRFIRKNRPRPAP